MRNPVKKTIYLYLFVPLLALAFSFAIPQTTWADTAYTNSSTNYRIEFEDGANLLDESEENRLIQAMKPITEYSNIAFLTTDSNSEQSTKSYSKYRVNSWFQGTRGTAFVIDMYHREIYIYSTDEALRTITSSYAYTITDNVYTYASRGDYYSCAARSYEQILTLWQDGRIAQPMKYISNALLALVLAALLNFLIILHVSRIHQPSNSELLSGLFSKFELHNANARFLNQTKTYDPISSGSSGGRSGGGGSSGGGGGGGGGGHSF